MGKTYETATNETRATELKFEGLEKVPVAVEDSDNFTITKEVNAEGHRKFSVIIKNEDDVINIVDAFKAILKSHT
jgi:hypothetical protein